MGNYTDFKAEFCQKYALYRKKAWNESSELNLVQETQRAHMSTSHPRGAGGYENMFEIL